MNILIIGGSGFVSSHVMEAALTAGHSVWYVTRGLRKPVSGAHPIIADRNDPAALANALRETDIRYDAVLDCICFNDKQARETLAVLKDFTNRVVAISTDSCYDSAYKTVPQDEHGEKYFEDDSYGAKKRRMELAFLNECPDSIKWTLFRPPHMYGPRSELGCFPTHTRQKDLLDHLRQGKPITLTGDGGYLLQALDARDLAKAMVACIDNSKTFNEIFCIAGPDVITNRAYFEVLGDILGLPVTFETTCESEHLAAHPDSIIYFCDRVYDLSKLKNAGLPVPAIGIRQGLKEQAEWLMAQGR
ncbi:MAG: NAD-dependent epimerase/dehydratase family protein [Oscillospiraceae bacterium]|nr:NAD-dependent epimerase/dehydratase family protein [Oscillospiraceae bacterium]